VVAQQHTADHGHHSEQQKGRDRPARIRREKEKAERESASQARGTPDHLLGAKLFQSHASARLSEPHPNTARTTEQSLKDADPVAEEGAHEPTHCWGERQVWLDLKESRCSQTIA
jgi:hypothetical protein